MKETALIFKVIVLTFSLAIIPVQVIALTPEQVFDKVKDSVVVVKALDSRGELKSQGSGVILPSDKIATNCHVVEEGISFEVGRNNQFVSAILYAKDADKDICILVAKGIMGKPAKLGKAANLKVGVPVYAVGAPYGLELSLSDGIVSQLRGGIPPLVQTTAAISPGSSGGGLFDREGLLVGLTTLYLEGGQNLNFAMPAEWIAEIKPGLKPITKNISHVQWLKQAIAIQELGDWHRLLNWCEEWIKSESSNATAWHMLGIAYSKFELYNDAIAAANQAIRLKPDFAEAYCNRGIGYRILGKYQQAINDSSKAIKLDPQLVDAYSNRGIGYRILGKYQQAMNDFNKAIKLDPHFADTYNARGVLYAKLGNVQQAINDYSKAIELHSQPAVPYYNRGLTYARLGNYEQAINDFDNAIAIDSEYAAAYYNRGVTYARLRNTKLALENCRMAARLGDKTAQEFLRSKGINW